MKVSKRYMKRLATVAVAFATVAGLAAPASAATVLSGVAVSASDPSKSATGVTYTASITSGGSGASVKCIRIYVDTAGAFTSGSLPAGLGNYGASPGGTFIGSAPTWTAAATSANYIQYGSSAGTGTTQSGATTVTWTMDSPTTAGTYYVMIETYNTTNCTGAVGDTGSGAFVTTDNVTVSVTVDPSFTFTVANKATTCNGATGYVDNSGGAATSLPLGHLTGAATASSGQTLTVGTNAANGFTVSAKGSNATHNLRVNGSIYFNDGTGTYSSGGGSSAALAAGEFGWTYADSTASTTLTAPASNTFFGMDATARNVMVGVAGIQSGSSCVAYEAKSATTTTAGSYSATVVYTAIPTF